MAGSPSLPRIVRALVLLLALLALVDPRWPIGAPAGDVIVVLDESQSMDPAFNDTLWTALSDQVQKLAHGSRFALLRFGARPALELPLEPVANPTVAAALQSHVVPRHATVDATATDIEAALHAALRLAGPGRAAGVLLVTDAQQTRGDAATGLSALADAGIPVRTLRPTRDATLADAWIAHLHVPAIARAGDAVPVTVTLDGRRNRQGELQLRVDGAPRITRPVSLSGDAPTTLRVTLPALASGPRHVTVVLDMPGDPVADNNRAAAVVNVEGPGHILYVHADAAPPPAVRSLRAGGWTVTETPAALLMRALAHAEAPSLIVLDDIAADAMTDAAWAQLETAVRLHGAGLWVLGGAHSFGAGAYRHSRLEGLLPVIAEANRPTPRAAVLFVVDKSGSMDRGEDGISRLAMARQGVIGSASALLAGDLVGLLAFDATTRELLPLDRHPLPAQTLDRAWRVTAHGGTELTPALRAAIARLQSVDVERRMLVVVTDGFTKDEDIESLAAQLRTRAIELVALVIGGNEEIQALARLVRAGDGTLLRVHELANLPRFMRREVERRRKPAQLGRHLPAQTKPLPFLSDVAAWPPLSGYTVTRPRPEATVFLESHLGDPLLAAHNVGTGRAAVLAGGLGGWAQSWWRWPEWGRFIGGMSAWLSARSGNPRLHLRLEQARGTQRLVVDALSTHGDWSTAERGQLRLQAVGDDLKDYPLTRVAPGRYASDPLVLRDGAYRALLRVGDESRRFEFAHASADERIPAADTEQVIAAWRSAGWVQPWRPGEPLLTAQAATAETSNSRTLLLLLCSVLFLGSLVAERMRVAWPLRGWRFKTWPPLRQAPRRGRSGVNDARR